MITMNELAHLCGVSQKTVSCVINHPDTGRASKETKERIFRLAQEYNFRINRNAVVLRCKKSFSVGIQMPMIFQPSSAIHASYLQKRFAKFGYHAIFSFHNTRNEIWESLEYLLNLKLDGLIVWDYDARLENENIPMAFYNIDLPGKDCLCVDNEYITRKECEVIASGKHQSVVYLRGGTRQAGLLREKTKKDGIELYDFSRKPLLDPKTAYEITLGLLRQKNFPSLFLTTDSLAPGVYAAVRECGLLIPNDVSIIGLDNLATSPFMDPPLDSFDLLMKKAIDLMTDMLIRRLENPEKAPERHLQDIRYIQRKSVR